MKYCLHCNEIIEGRSDKKYCTPYCKSAYQYEKSKEKEDSLYIIIDKQLKLNRKILKYYNKTGMATIEVLELINKGFDPNYFTHYWKNSQGEVYLFCYEFGFLKKTVRRKQRFILVKWQSYMK